MRIAIMFLAVAVLAPPTRLSAQDREREKVPPYYHYIMENCRGKTFEVTLDSGERLSGKCRALLADRFQLTRKGVTYEVRYASIAKINARRRWLGKLKGAVVAPYTQIKTAVGIAKFYGDFL